VPVVNPAKVAVGVAEALVRSSLLPSRLAYPQPPKLVMSPRSFRRRAREGRS
jgi:hypothetical protein